MIIRVSDYTKKGLKYMAMIGWLGLHCCSEICHWRASSRLFIPRECNVLALLIKRASRACLTESRVLRISSRGIR